MKVVADKTFQMRVTEDFLRTIDEWRRAQADLPPRAEAIRRLVAVGIASQPILRPLLEMLERSPEASDPDVQRSIRELRAALGEA